jgi:speckle-type POZ protein
MAAAAAGVGAGAGAAPPASSKQRCVATTRLVPRAEFEYEWKLTGVTKEFFTEAAVGEEVVSPPFTAHGLEWMLKLDVNGYDAETAGYVGVYVRLRTQNTTVAPTVTLRAGEKAEFRLGAPVFTTSCASRTEVSSDEWGSAEYLSHTRLLKHFDAHVPGGVFTVTASLRLPGFEARTNPIAVPAPSLSAGLSALLASGEHTDVTLVCGDERIAAHSLLLRTRSPVFAAQLDPGPLQADASAVPVPPEITPHTLRRLLLFLYTDELEPVSPEEATHLLNAADHYDVPRLFAICERTLCVALSVENAAETLTLADQHSAARLKDAALRFVAGNALAVMATTAWAHLVSARPPLVLEAMHTMAAGEPPVAPVRLSPGDGAGAGAGAAGASNEGATLRPRKRAR